MTLKLMGRKRGMTQFFDQDGKAIVCTVIEAEQNVVSQLKTTETDGYNAVQTAFEQVQTKDPRTAERRIGKPLSGKYSKLGLKAHRHLIETRVDDADAYKIGQTLSVDQFAEGTYVDVSGVSKGRGYQGVMFQYGFGGFAKTHGAGPVHRHGGSTGQRSTPGRCFPGGKRAGRMGGDKITVQNLRVVAVDAAKNLLVVCGAVPGARNGLIVVSKAVKRSK